MATTGLSFALSACGGGGATEPGDFDVEGTTARGSEGLAMTTSELVGRPTDHSVTVKASFDMGLSAYLEYGSSSGTYSAQTSTATFANGQVELVATGLDPNALYYYRLRYRATGSAGAFSMGTEHTFRTQRSPSSTFTFDIQTDSHQGYPAFYSSALYGITMQNIASDHPDLLFDLGDSVSTDDATETASTVNQKYANQRNVFGLAAHSTAVYLVLGNHENEEGWNLDDMGTSVASSLPVLGANGRKRYFANPVPDGFYTGNGETLAQIQGDHLRGDYYAFEWGSALFVALDPFWYTVRKPYAGGLGGEKDDEVVGDRWDWTLGKAQYDWLSQTLSSSTAQFKFVFAHHTTGGTDDYSRAGALGAKYCEWGGYDPDGTTWGFDTRRPGWAMPVHHLLSENGVTAFFHGHDHVFAQEVLDGVVYQECPHAANPDYGSGFSSNATDYAGAALVNNSGHLRVTVSPTLVSVDYVRAYLPGDGANGGVALTYTISPCQAAHSDNKVCDDGNACTSGDHCVAGSCQPGAAVSCDDGNVCSTDTCDASAGCAHASNTLPCDDGSLCTTNDTCADRSCVGQPVVCGASDECHVAGTCEPASGCSNPAAPDDSPCSLGRCTAGTCVTPPETGGRGGGGGQAGATAGGGQTGATGGSAHEGGEGGVSHGQSGEGGESHGHGGSHSVGGSHSMGGSHATGGSSGADDSGESGSDASGTSGAGASQGGSDAGAGDGAAAGRAGAKHSGGSAGSAGTAANDGGRSGGAQAGSTADAGSAGRRGRQLGPIGGKGSSGCACSVPDTSGRGAGAWIAALGLGLVLAGRRRQAAVTSSMRELFRPGPNRRRS
jgi:MYXO-CTERM domain-containing protein